MGKKKTARGALLAANLPQLQNLIKRDPDGYKDEFLCQLNHFESIRRIFELKPADEEHGKRFRELIGFLSQVAPCYPKETKELPRHFSSMLLQNYAVLNPDGRCALVRGVVLLRNKLVITSIELLQTLFPLLPRTTSATLRSFIRKTILTDIKAANTKSKNHKLNRAIQAMMFDMVERGTDALIRENKGSIQDRNLGTTVKSDAAEEAMWAVTLAKELWTCHVWSDAKTVSIIALACFHPSLKVQRAASYFFLGDEDVEAGEIGIEASIKQPVRETKSLQRKQKIKKLTPGGEKKLARSLDALRKFAEKRTTNQSSANFPALQLLHDPQSFGEKLYESLLQHDKRLPLDHKILQMELLSRVMGTHKLCILGFYSYIVRYLAYHQTRVTIILVSLAQSVHDLTPPDILAPIIKKLAQEFVHPGVGSEVIAAGINAICEVCRRQPWCMDEDLLGDLIEYRKSNDKGVVFAARSLLQLYREVSPHILKRRERGKAASMNPRTEAPVSPYGRCQNSPQTIKGLELLKSYLELRHETSQAQVESIADNDDWVGWDVESTDSSDSGSWIAVRSDDPDLDISDIDDTEPVVNTSMSTAIPPGRDDLHVTLAATKILTPADFAILSELRMEAAKASIQGGSSSAKRKIAALEATRLSCSANEHATITEADILGPRKKAKADYAERMGSVHKGREGREKFGSSRGKERNGIVSSSTNREKARQKPVMMVLASSAVRGKKRASLRDKQKKMRAHIERAKKAAL